VPLLLDTGVLYALADADDAWHDRCRRLIERRREALLAPASVLPEVAYLLRERLGNRAERAFTASLAEGALAVEDLKRSDYERALGVLDDYPDIGFVDASVVAVAERLKLSAIATTDRRHFGAIRPRHAPAFELLP
jgi:predicted nucleic acid-binding protein